MTSPYLNSEKKNIIGSTAANKGFGKVGFGNKPSAFVILLSFCTLAVLKKRYGQGQTEGILFPNLPKAPDVGSNVIPLMQNFQIDIVDQHWILNDPNNTDDMCSHGIFLININGVEIASRSEDVEWTTNTSALRLLKTIDENYIEDTTTGLLLHCGQIQMLSCPISISWNVIHSKDTVRISHIKKYLTTSKEEVIEFPGLNVEISKMEYKNEIIKVAHQVKAFYTSSKRRKYFDEQDRIENIRFWVKFDTLFSKHSH